MAVIKNVQVADPGVSLSLDLTGLISPTKSLPNLTVSATVTNPDGTQHNSVFNINSPIFDSSNNPVMVIVMPYGDVNYPVGQQVRVNISASFADAGGSHSIDSVSNLPVMAQSGKFNVSVV